MNIGTERPTKPTILIVEDDIASAQIYQSYLEPDYSVLKVHTGEHAMQLIEHEQIDAILLDIQLPDVNGRAVLSEALSQKPDVPIIMMTGTSTLETAVELMQLGAADFLAKPFDKARLLVTMVNCLKKIELNRMVNAYEKSAMRKSLHKMIGESLPMQTVYNIIQNAAGSRASLFITGESGTGKELCAEAIHKESNRKEKPYVALNCAAIPRELIESEIFGHTKGAFTGAVSARSGAAKKADGGTLFLDEIGELPYELQSTLLRFIQTGTFQPVGSSQEIKVDIRFICATNRDPLLEVKAGRFREDLYYRLNVIPIHMPPLRERHQDVLAIARAFLEEFNKDEDKGFKGFSTEVEQFLLGYPWPGNVRELSNVIRNTVVLNNGDLVEMNMLPNGLQTVTSIEPEPLQNTQTGHAISQNAKQSDVDNTITPLWIEEKRVIERAIRICKGNIPKAAAFLDISASTIYRKRQQWEAMESS